MSPTVRFLMAASMVAILVIALSGCGGGAEPIPYSQAGIADTGVPTVPPPRLDCIVRPEQCI